MSIKVKGFLKDVGGASRVTKLREENFANGSPRPDPKDPIRELADKLHPEHMVFRCVDIREASPSARVFRFESADGHIPTPFPRPPMRREATKASLRSRSGATCRTSCRTGCLRT